MKIMKYIIGLLLCLCSAALIVAPPAPAAEAPALTVGRIFHSEGELLRYVPEEADWVAVVKDAPFAAADTLFSGTDGMAELIVPNGLTLRIGNGTQLQFISLEPAFAEMDVASGMARFLNKGQAALKVSTPFGYALAEPGAIFDVYVGENSVEVVAIKGTVSFVHPASERRYSVTSGANSLLADQQQVSWGEGAADADWNRWNMERENFWLAKEMAKGPASEYLPPELHNEAYALDENGRWERVFYEGEERLFWRPTAVAGDWSPFTVGRWTDWSGEQTWIPAEPFGYVTHHYGNWVNVRNRWYWAPPVARWRIGLPFLDIGFFWYPGRVFWIHSGVNVGWAPLAPRETYYSRRPWGGPHTVVVNNININRISLDIRSHAYVDHAVIVNRRHFNSRDDYRNVRITSINRTVIINNYRSAPVVNNTVIKNYTTGKQRYNYTNIKVNEKPHPAVIKRIQNNQELIREGRQEKAPQLQERVKGLPEGKINREVRIESPRITNHIVPVRDVNKPAADLKLPKRESKKQGVGGAETRPVEIGRPGKPAERPLQPAPKPERLTPASPPQPENPLPAAPKPERVAPIKPIQVERTVQPPARPAPKAVQIAPANPPQQKPVQELKPAEKPASAPPTKTEHQKDSLDPEESPDRPERTKQTPPHARGERNER